VTDKWKIRLQLTKPVTWVPLIWGEGQHQQCPRARMRRFVQGVPNYILRVMSYAVLAGVLCGAAASGQFTWTPDNVGKSVLCMFMSGPLLTGYTQVHLVCSHCSPAQDVLPGFAIICKCTGHKCCRM
jgi:chlorophyll/bacteriochlorophyll a synthase